MYEDIDICKKKKRFSNFTALISVGEVTNVLTNLSDDEFEKRFDKKKPTHDTKVILSCRSGKRSAMVQSDIQKLGYKK